MAKRGNSNAKLADSLIRRLTPPATGNKVHYDSDVAGFGMRITAAGARAFILNYYTTAGRERRYTIGGVEDDPVDPSPDNPANRTDEADKPLSFAY